MNIFHNMNIFLVIILALIGLFISYYSVSFLISLIFYLLTQKDKSNWKEDLKKMISNTFWSLFGMISKFKK
ncbi:hypothetical protein CAMA108575_05140 [Catellicoccus marimammalium]